MKAKLTLNIGAADMKRLELEKGKDGDVVEVSEKVFEVLNRNGWAVQAPESKAK